MNTQERIIKMIDWGANPRCVRLRLTRRTVMKFAKPEKKGGPLFYRGIEIVPDQKAKKLAAENMDMFA